MAEFTNYNSPSDKTNKVEEFNRAINNMRNSNYGRTDPLYNRNDASILPTPFGNISYSDAFFDLMKNWLIDLNKTLIKAMNSYEYPDLRMFLPRAYFINWSDPKIRETESFNPTIWIPSLYTSKEDQNRLAQSFKVFGDILGDFIVAGKKAGGHIVEEKGKINQNVYNLHGDGIILGNNSQVTTTILQIDPQFRKSVEEFENILKEKLQLKNIQITDEQRQALQEDVQKLTQEVKGVNPQELLVDEDKIDEIKATQMSLAEKIVEFVPQVAASIASLTPLAPFSEVIGKGAGYFADWINKKLNRTKS